MQTVEDILDLKFCTDGVQTALQNEDYEQAAAHVHRFLSLDENILRMASDASEGKVNRTISIKATCSDLSTGKLKKKSIYPPHNLHVFFC